MNYTVNINHKKLGKGMIGFVLVTVDYKLLKEAKMTQYDLGRKIKAISKVEEADIVTGGTDIIVKVRVSDIDELSDFVTKALRNIEGVEKTQTMVVLSEI